VFADIQNTLSVHFNGHSPGEPGLAGVYHKLRDNFT